MAKTIRSNASRPLSIARSVLDAEIAGLEAVRSQLNKAFVDAVELIIKTVANRRKIVVCGIGKSGNIGRKIAATFSSTGTPAVVLNSVDAVHGDIGIIDDGDLILALSYSGESDELVQLLPAFKRLCIQIVTVTGVPNSTLGRHSDIVIPAAVKREACPFNLAPTASTTACLALGDALAVAVMQLRGFKPRDFALRHPAGAIGRAMLLKVRDIMRSGDRHPVALESSSVKDALLMMTQARSGSLSVVNRAGRLVGVFTDGDLRRRIPRTDDLLNQTLRSVMTPRPISIRDTALAVEAVRIFNERSIDDLIVVNSRRKPVGTIDLQDLPKLKLM